jgi:hypothetical protein
MVYMFQNNNTEWFIIKVVQVTTHVLFIVQNHRISHQAVPYCYHQQDPSIVSPVNASRAGLTSAVLRVAGQLTCELCSSLYLVS